MCKQRSISGRWLPGHEEAKPGRTDQDRSHSCVRYLSCNAIVTQRLIYCRIYCCRSVMTTLAALPGMRDIPVSMRNC